MQMLLLESQLPSLPRSMQNFLVSLHWEAELPPYADMPLLRASSSTLFPQALLALAASPSEFIAWSGCPSHLLGSSAGV